MQATHLLHYHDLNQPLSHGIRSNGSHRAPLAATAPPPGHAPPSRAEPHRTASPQPVHIYQIQNLEERDARSRLSRAHTAQRSQGRVDGLIMEVRRPGPREGRWEGEGRLCRRARAPRPAPPRVMCALRTRVAGRPGRAGCAARLGDAWPGTGRDGVPWSHFVGTVDGVVDNVVPQSRRL